MKCITQIIFVLFLLIPSIGYGQSAAELRKHVEFLASPTLEGRKAGTPGCDKAATYIH